MQFRDEHFRALFEPSGVAVAGAATHPGKFGFVALHNLLACGYEGRLLATNRSGEPVLGIPTARSVDDLPDGSFDLVFVCVPGSAAVEVLRQSAAKGAKAAFVASAGYGEAGDDGRRAQEELVEVATELDMLLAGPNGQGIVSTPASLLAQIVAPYPPPGPIGIASQSGGFVSTFCNYARRTGVGVSRAVSAGNVAQCGVVDYLEWFATDDATSVGLAYLEDVPEPDATVRRLEAVCRRMPVVVLRGGRTEGGARAVGAHTGSVPAPAGFDDALRAAGVTVVGDPLEAYEAAATFATQPRPAGPRTVVYSTAGGWGVITAEAIERSELELLPLPDDLRSAIDEHLPPRWSRSNPIDLAGSETRDTIPTLMHVVASHPDVDAVVYLGLGIQSNQAALARSGPFHPDHGLDRIVEFHERQDARYATAAHEASVATGKPVLTATELAYTNPENPGPATVRETGRVCYLGGDRAVRALEHLWRYQRWLSGRQGS